MITINNVHTYIYQFSTIGSAESERDNMLITIYVMFPQLIRDIIYT